jgi:hypothetical protein
MNTRHEHGETERGEGLGGRVRRFVDSELSRVLDKDREGRETDRGRVEPARAPGYDRPQEPITPYASTIGSASHPVTTAPVDPGPVDPAPVDPGPVDPGPVHPAPVDSAPADDSAERVGLLNDPAGLRDQWQRVQGTFVDDPARAVQEASVLVNRTLQEIRENVTRGQINDPTSTEDLRVSFQRYREFFQRLLSA